MASLELKAKNLSELLKNTLIAESRLVTKSGRLAGSGQWENLMHMTSSAICDKWTCSTMGCDELSNLSKAQHFTSLSTEPVVTSDTRHDILR